MPSSGGSPTRRSSFSPWSPIPSALPNSTRGPRPALVVADVTSGFRIFRERFTSRVALDPPRRIDVAYTEGPFRYLNNHWVFEKVPGGCRLDFFVDFEFTQRLLQRVIELLFHEAVRRMVGAFETRAQQLYGKPARDPASKAAV